MSGLRNNQLDIYCCILDINNIFYNVLQSSISGNAKNHYLHSLNFYCSDLAEYRRRRGENCRLCFVIFSFYLQKFGRYFLSIKTAQNVQHKDNKCTDRASFLQRTGEVINKAVKIKKINHCRFLRIFLYNKDLISITMVRAKYK